MTAAAQISISEPRRAPGSGGIAPASGGIVLPPVQGRVAALLADQDGTATVLLASRTFSQFVVARVRADGTLDSAFATAGVARVGLEDQATLARAMTRQPDGKILALGSAQRPGPLRLVVVRLTASGQLDPSFSGDGRRTVSVPDADQLDAAAVLVQSDGGILVVGSAIAGFSSNATGRIVVSRLLPDGGLDLGYGTLGRIQVPLPGALGRPVAAALDAAGNLVLAGHTFLPDSESDMVVVRLRPDGAADPTFGTGGLALVDFGTGNDSAAQLLIADGGRIVLSGTAQQAAQATRPAVVRLRSDGTLDPEFGVGGRATIDVPLPAGLHSGGGVALLPGGRLAVTGIARDTNAEAGRAVTAVLTSAGAVDPTFSGDGIELPVFPQPAQSNGRVAGTAGGGFVAAFTVGADDSTLTSLGLVRVLGADQMADLKLEFGADGSSAGPGPLTFTAAVTNAGPAIAHGVRLTVTASQTIAVVEPAAGRAIRLAAGPGATVPLGSIPPGGEARASFRTTVTGFEGTIFARAAVTAVTPDFTRGDNERVVEVLTSPLPTE